MKKWGVVLVVLGVGLVVASPAQASIKGQLAPAVPKVTATVSSPQRQVVEAGWAFFAMTDPNTVGPNDLWGDSCYKLKRNRWRCPRTYTGTMLDGSPIQCELTVLVSREWWRFPPEWFGCPAAWNPSTSAPAA